MPSTFSFPSGHVAATVVCWIGAALLLAMFGRVRLARVVAAAGALMVVFVAWARVYLGMHYALDTALGMAMGGGALVIATRALWPSASDRAAQRNTSAAAVVDDDAAPHTVQGLSRRQLGSVTGMKIRLAHAAAVAAILTIASCSEDTQDAVESDLESCRNRGRRCRRRGGRRRRRSPARNIATQQGEEQFNNAGHELDGPLTCEATVQDGVAQIDISCTGTTKDGGAAALTGTTNEIPGASVVTLDGDFTGTVDGAEVFTTERLGG